MYENKRILILGAAKSGIAVAKLLAHKNNDITLSDLQELDKDVEMELDRLGIKVVIGDNQLDLIDDSFDLIIKNPAIMYVSDIVKKVEKLGLRMENEMEVAYHFLPKDITIIGVTGSNGKTTTTTMIYELLKRMGKPVVLGGNIGTPLAEIVDSVRPNDILLLEISDHQLIDFNDFKTNISVLTNICPTHLDYHGNYEHYMETKKNIFNHHTSLDLAIINKGNVDSLKITEEIVSNRIYFNDDINYFNEKGIYINGELIVGLDEILLQGNHNYENILTALLVVNEFGIDKEVVRNFYKEFGGVEHRLEFVRNVNGVKYYNDSKATNPTSTVIALKTFNNPVHLILGGLDRKQDFNELNGYINNVKCIYAIGEVTEKIDFYAKEQEVPCYKCFDLNCAMKEIVKNVQTGDIVLLSTASSAQDQYIRFEDRGEEFKNFVAKL